MVEAIDNGKIRTQLSFADKAWEAFRNDPEWKAAYAASREDGPIVDKVESSLMYATDYSPIR